MALSIGIVGLPNVGKSTLFVALTKKSVLIANYPFATIDPSVGVVAVPDQRLDKLAVFSSSEKKIPAAVEFVDIAGLVRGASEGEGLGNQFLQHIREVDAIAHVVRIFDNPNTVSTQEHIDPLHDIELINTELELADIDKKENLLSKKPVLYVLNKESGGHNLDENPGDERWGRLMNYLSDKNYVIVDAHVEHELKDLHTDDKQQFRQEYGALEDGVNDLIKAGYELLGLISFFTTGKDETRAWTIKKGSAAPRAGAAIHGDFETKFIRAEVINWKELIHVGGWGKAREAGKLRLVGRDYVIQEGDVVEIKI